jgi:hypothetical protein
MGAEGAGGRGAQLEVERIRRELVALYRRHNETKGRQPCSPQTCSLAAFPSTVARLDLNF